VPGLTVKKKKKRTSLAEVDGGEPAEPAAEEASAPPAPPPAAPQPRATPAPEPPAPAPVVQAQAPLVETPAPLPQTPSEPEPLLELPPEAEDLGELVELEPLEELEAAAPEAIAASEPDAPSIAAEAPAAPAQESKPSASEPGSDVVRPAARRPGKVVGFVDLSKVQAPQAPRKPELRRLRSKDDVAPDVQPTLGHDKRRALLRGDQASRGQLTPAQLREKESARFLRRKGAPSAAPSRGSGRTSRGSEPSPSPLAGGTVSVESPVTVKKLADALSLKSSQVLAKAMESNLGLLNINSPLDDDTAQLLALEFQVTLAIAQEHQAETVMLEELVRKRTAVEEADLVVRPPTIAFLGHVDHGKTSLIDRIRNSRIAEGESGGITQHIGAYQVQTKSGHTLTILDTPGHQAFTAMRARGAHAVDIVVLVVAADDGVMPATKEALDHARAAKVPIVVALNKVDKPEANPPKVRQQLAGENLLSEEWGGTTAMLEVSALTGKGVDELLERVFLESEVLELKSHKRGPASGVVLEAEVQEGKGRVAHLLVKDGTLKKGDVILAGEGYGKVRSIHDDRGREIDTAGPSMPVQVSGLSEYLPTVGDTFHVIEKLETAREVAEERRKKVRAQSMTERRAVTSENILQAVADQSKKVINLILRTDVQGSLQALEQQLAVQIHPEVDVRLLSSGLGTVTESDVNLAATSGGMVLAFRVGTNSEARAAADRSNVEIRPYDVIYELLDDVRNMMEGTLAPEMTQQITGHIEVRVLFKSSKFGNIAGSHVIDGAVQRDNKVRVRRGNKVIHEGAIAALRREKDEVREVREGFDCGVTLRDFDGFEVGDVIEGYKIVAVKRKLQKA
jgi:translation initiation factor IF-2